MHHLFDFGGRLRIDRVANGVGPNLNVGVRAMAWLRLSDVAQHASNNNRVTFAKLHEFRTAEKVGQDSSRLMV